MKRTSVLTALLAVAAQLCGAQAPSSEIFLAPLRYVRDSIVVGAVVNITHRGGYNNQPSFLPNSRGILYTAIGSDAQADIWRYDIVEKRTARVTSTPESEYSPTVMPGGARMSVIRVEQDSTQRLWSFALDGTEPQLLLGALKPVGYHAWLGGARLVAYVLGKPATLHVIKSDGTGDEIRAVDVGRSLQRIPGMEAFTFTQRDSTNASWVTAHYVADNSDVRLVRTTVENEYHVWTPTRALLSTHQGKLVKWNGALDATSQWEVVADLSKAGVKKISRLAVSPDGKWLAFVAEIAAP
ncbi:MAG: beta-lactamase [Gemmatimonadetes bacterium]|nr:beta-lactamase [Gemmatimonadota bacterium]